MKPLTIKKCVIHVLLGQTKHRGNDNSTDIYNLVPHATQWQVPVVFSHFISDHPLQIVTHIP